MKKILLALSSMVLSIVSIQAQHAWVKDSVTIGTGTNTQDVYYSMKNGLQKAENNRNWHIGFTLSPIGDSAAVWANHLNGNNFTRVYNIHKDSSQWNTVTLADTLSANMLYNNDQGWFQGAFNAIPSNDPFNFGWGHYDMTSHNIVGDSIFIVKANNIFYKFFIQKLKAIPPVKWYFQFENLTTPGNAIIDSIEKSPVYDNSLMAYYSLETATDTNREPAIANWDVVFGRYTTDAVGSGQGVNNNVLGVLNNKGITVAKAVQVQVDSAYNHYSSYTANSIISTIGYDWKTLTNIAPPQYKAVDSLSYFVNDKTGNLWQLQFTGYTPTTGYIAFQKRLVAPVSVSQVNSNVAAYEIFPNPVQSNVSVVLQAKTAGNATISIYNAFGQQVLNTPVYLVSGVNAYSIPLQHLNNGTYIIAIKQSTTQITQKIQIQH